MTIAAVLAFLALHAPMPAGAVIHQSRCPDYAPSATTGFNCTRQATGDIYIDPEYRREMGTLAWRAVIAHELGHLWDYQHLGGAQRARYAAFIGQPGVAWTSVEQENALIADPMFAPIPPIEQFADTYALCALGYKARRHEYWDSGHYFGPGYGRTITRRDLAATCWLLRQE